ncbi:coatomer subunit zeta-2 isoform 3-T3 [Porphyrio hochstetteri]
MEPVGPEPSLYTVKALLILDSLGQRLLAKYYDSTFPTAKEQAAFERSIFSKTHRAGGEITCLGGLTVVYRSSIDLFFYVVGGCQENELMLLAVLTCLLDSLGHLLRKEVEKRWLLDNMEGTFLVVDEIVDRGSPSQQHMASSSSTTWQVARGRGTPETPSSTEVQTLPCAGAPRGWAGIGSGSWEAPSCGSLVGGWEGAGGGLLVLGYPAGPLHPAPKAAGPLPSPRLMTSLCLGRARPR